MRSRANPFEYQKVFVDRTYLCPPNALMLSHKFRVVISESKPVRVRMVANVGAVGALSCRVSGAEIQAAQQSYSLTGCQLDPGAVQNK